jgi:NitT/TauT family transport system substrate-binding protein
MMSTNTRRPARAISALAVLAAGALALSACAGSSSPGTSDPSSQSVDPFAPEVTEFSVAGYPNAATTQLSLATSEGFTEEYGIDVALQPAENAPAMLAQIISGDVPIGQVNGFFSVPAVMEGADLVVIGELLRGVPGGQTVEVRADSGIASAMLAEGADPSKVEFVSLGWNEMPAALEQGTVDAVTVIGPAQLQLQTELGTSTVLDLGDGMFAEFPDSQWLANGAWARENPNTVAAFQCAVVVKGQAVLNEDQEAYEAALRDFGFSDQAIADDKKFIYPEANEPAQIIPDIMFEMGWIDEEFDISAITIPLPDNC